MFPFLASRGVGKFSAELSDSNLRGSLGLQILGLFLVSQLEWKVNHF